MPQIDLIEELRSLPLMTEDARKVRDAVVPILKDLATRITGPVHNTGELLADSLREEMDALRGRVEVLIENMSKVNLGGVT